MNSWKEYLLEDVVDKFIDYRGKTPNKTTAGIPLITAKIVKDGRLLDPNEFIAIEDYKSWMTRGFPEINDIVLTTEAPLGEVALIRDKNIALAQRVITLQTNKMICDSIFLKYYFQSSIGRGRLESRASGSTVEGIKSAELRKVEITLPPLEEQKAIAGVLSSLDDKIDLLHRQNKTLESLAETMFRQWFIEEAKENWEEIFIGSIVSLFQRSINPNKNTETLYHHYSIPAFDDCQVPVVQRGSEILSSKNLVIGKTILLSKLNPTIQRIWPVPFEVPANSICSTEFLVIKPHEDNSYCFILYLLKSKSVMDELVGAAGGTSGSHQRINSQDLLNLIIKIPNQDVITKYNSIISPLLCKNYHNQQEIIKITKIRETILPKIMSGEARVN